MNQGVHRETAALQNSAASLLGDDTRPRKLRDETARAVTSNQSAPTVIDYPEIFRRPTSALRWCVRLSRGWSCRLRLDRRDVGPMVHTMWNFGEPLAAIEACKTILVSNPQHVYAYIHIVDLAARDVRDFRRAHRYYMRGLSTLSSPHDRELLASFFLYTAVMNSILGS
jgi:hypothetical protein